MNQFNAIMKQRDNNCDIDNRDADINLLDGWMYGKIYIPCTPILIHIPFLFLFSIGISLPSRMYVSTLQLVLDPLDYMMGVQYSMVDLLNLMCCTLCLVSCTILNVLYIKVGLLYNGGVLVLYGGSNLLYCGCTVIAVLYSCVGLLYSTVLYGWCTAPSTLYSMVGELYSMGVMYVLYVLYLSILGGWWSGSQSTESQPRSSIGMDEFSHNHNW